jgi:hypothetical protein
MLLTLASAVFLGFESLGTSDHILLSQIWEFHFRCLLRFAGSRWRYSTPPPHECQLNSNLVPLVTPRHGPRRKHFSLLSLIIAVGTCLFAKPLFSNGCCIFSYSAVVAYQRALFIESLLSNGSVCYGVKTDFKAIVLEGVDWINRIYVGTNSRLLWARL